MGKKAIQETTLTNIAEAIRAVLGTTDLMTVDNMPTKILEIPSGPSFNVVAFDACKPLLDSGFVSFASTDEENLFYEIFSTLTTLSGVVNGLATSLTIDFNVHTFEGSTGWENYYSIITALATGAELTLENIDVTYADTFKPYKLVGYTCAGNIKLSNCNFEGSTVMEIAESLTKIWCKKLTLENCVFSTLATLTIGGCAVEEVSISATTGADSVTITNSTENNIKKLKLDFNNKPLSINNLLNGTYSSALEEINLDWANTPLISINSAFKNSTLITGLTAEFDINLTGCIDCANAFEGVAWLTKLNITGDMGLSNYYLMFYGCSNLTSITGELKGNFKSGGVLTSMFEGCSSLVSLPAIQFGSAENPTTTLSRMFYGCSALEAIDVTIAVSGSPSLASFASGCSSLKSFKVSLIPEVSASENGPSSWTNLFEIVSIEVGTFEKLDISGVPFNNLTSFTDSGFFRTLSTIRMMCLFWGKHPNADVIWPDEIKFEHLSSSQTFAIYGCKAGIGADFVRKFVSSNQTINLTITADDYATLTEDEINNFNNNGGVLSKRT